MRRSLPTPSSLTPALPTPALAAAAAAVAAAAWIERRHVHAVRSRDLMTLNLS